MLLFGADRERVIIASQCRYSFLEAPVSLDPATPTRAQAEKAASAMLSAANAREIWQPGSGWPSTPPGVPVSGK
jgi:hypothetical protein